jgi:hypothetical protein
MIEINAKVVNPDYSIWPYEVSKYSAENEQDRTLHLDQSSLISLSIYRDRTMNLTILKPQRYWPFTELKHLCIYILRDNIISIQNSAKINLKDVEVIPKCYQWSVFFHQLLVQRPESNTQLFFIIRNDLKIGLLTFNLDTLTFKDETNTNQEWQIPVFEKSTVWGVKSFMRHSIQNIIVISTLTRLYVYNLETDWQHGYIVNLLGIFDFTKFFSFNGYTDIIIKDFLVWRGNIIVMCMDYYDSYQEVYATKAMFIYMDLSEDFYPFLLASIDINKLLGQPGKISDADFKIF